MSKNSSKRAVITALSSITQLGLQVTISFLLWILIAKGIQKLFDLGNFIMVIGVVLGAGSGFMSIINFCKHIQNHNRKDNLNEQ